MAVIQISKMQVRRGQTKQTNMPQLSSGEFGWSIDTQQLFIGNGAITEGAPAVGNTEIITEHNINNFFLYVEAGYKYYSTLTDVGSVFRPIQEKLDDFVSLNDFVTTSTDYSVAIQRAITHASNIGKPLYMPEGRYSVTATIYIPPKTEIRGAGLGKTYITVAPASTNTVFQTISLDGNIFESGDMGSSSVIPNNIKINGISFVSTFGAQPILRLDCIANSVVENCEFKGHESISTATSTLTTAIVFRDLPTPVTNNVAIKNCVFNYLGTAVYSDYEISDIVISENKFYVLDTGIVFGKKLNGAQGRTFGARHVRVLSNVFDTINNQAIYVGTTSTAKLSAVSDITSMNNSYINVGNQSAGDSITKNVVEVIRFESWGNVSKNDNFARLNVNNDASESAQFKALVDAYQPADKLKPVILGPTVIESSTPKFYYITSPNFTENPFFVYPLSAYNYGINDKPNVVITIDYTVVKPGKNLIRRGTLEIVVNGNSRTNTVIKDTFSSTVEEREDEFSFVLIPTETVTLPDYINRNNAIVVFVKNRQYQATLSYTYTVRQ